MLVGGLDRRAGRVDVFVLIGIAWASAVAGDVTSLYLGRRLGRSFLVKHGPKVSITEERLHVVEGFFDRHGGKAILIGRFVGLVRAIAPFLAGSSGLTLRRFLPYDVIGAGLWTSTFILLGYVFWHSFGDAPELRQDGGARARDVDHGGRRRGRRLPLAARGRAPPPCSWRGSTRSSTGRCCARWPSCCVPRAGCCAAPRSSRGTA